MPRVPFEKAFSLTPTHRLVVGEKTFDVPPLTLGRFLSLVGADFTAVRIGVLKDTLTEDGAAGPAVPPLAVVEGLIAQAKADGTERELREMVEREFPDLLRELARVLRALSPEAVASLVLAVVPGLDPADWKAHGTPIAALELFRFFYGVHDWAFISDTIGFGKPKEKDEQPTTKATVSGALVAFCRAHPFVSPEGLLATRIEGFFYLRGGANEVYEKAEASAIAEQSMTESEFIQATGAPVGKASRELLDAIARADEEAGLN